MFLRKYTPVTPSLRWIKNTNILTYFNPVFTNFIKKKKNLNHKKYLINSFTKKYKKIPNFNNFFFKTSILNLIIGIHCTISKHFINIIKNVNNQLQLIKNIHGLFIGDFIKNLLFPIKFIKYFFLGSQTTLKYLPLFSIISNIQIWKNNYKICYAKATGSYAQLSEINNNLKLNLLILPSGKKKYFFLEDTCFFGRNGNIFSKYSIIGKAGKNRNLGKNSIVRGVAKNPIDHPHGGRTKTVQPEVSPWGWVTKHNH